MVDLDTFNLQKEMKKIQEMINGNEDDFDYKLIKDEFDIDLKEIERQMMDKSKKIDLFYKKLNEGSVNPFYNYDGDSGFDLFSTEDVIIEPLGRALIPTGLSFGIPDGFEIQIRSKSGLAINQGLMVLNSPGTVDGGFLGEIKVILFNTNQKPFTVKKGMKVGQAVLCPVVCGKWVNLSETDDLGSSDRNSNGFGSTGVGL